MIDAEQIVKWANRAQRNLCLEGNILLQCAKGPFVAGQETYNLPTNYLKADAVFLTNDSGFPRQLRPIDMSDRDPREPQGCPEWYYIWGEDVGTPPSNQYIIGFQNIPDSRFPVSPVKCWEVFYRKRPRTMVHSTLGTMVDPEVIPEFQDAMHDYVIGMAYRRRGDWAAFGTQMTLWKAHLATAKAFINPLTFDYPTPRRDTAGYTYPEGY